MTLKNIQFEMKLSRWKECSKDKRRTRLARFRVFCFSRS